MSLETSILRISWGIFWRFLATTSGTKKIRSEIIKSIFCFKISKMVMKWIVGTIFVRFDKMKVRCKIITGFFLLNQAHKTRKFVIPWCVSFRTWTPTICWPGRRHSISRLYSPRKSSFEVISVSTPKHLARTLTIPGQSSSCQVVNLNPVL